MKKHDKMVEKLNHAFSVRHRGRPIIAES